MTRKLIEEELPLAEVNEQSRSEKYLSRSHISALHRWWARRPLAMSRAVVFGSLLPADAMPRDAAMRAIADAVPFSESANYERLQPLRAELIRAYGDQPPRVLDCFAGGGAIPLEALRLGCETHAIDLNPVAHLMELCALDYPQRFGSETAFGHSELADSFRTWAQLVGERTEERLREAFSAGSDGQPALFYWARTMLCGNPLCGREIPLVSCLIPPRSSGVWLDIRGPVPLLKQLPAPDDVDVTEGTVRSSSATCPSCGASRSAAEVRKYGKTTGFGTRLYGVASVTRRRRYWRRPTESEQDTALAVARRVLEDLTPLDDGTTAIPDEECDPNGFRRVQTLGYGYSSWRSLFNDRQLAVLGVLCDEVRGVHREMIAAGDDPERAKAITTYLGLCVNRIADWNSAFCGEKNTFPRQALRMLWDFVEINPFAETGGNWAGAVDLISSVIDHCHQASDVPAFVHRGDAQRLPFEDRYFDAVIIDPPYYDAIQYSYLSDFFYVWLRRSVGELYPLLFSTQATPKSQEVLQNQAKKTSPDFVSKDEFEARLQRALSEIARVVKDEGLVTIVFAHTEVAAWEYLLRALRIAGLVVTTSWPMRSEMGSRSTAQTSAVLSSSVVLVCRRSQDRGEGFYDDVVRALEARLRQRLDEFDGMGLVGADYFVSAIGPAFEVFAQYERVIRLSGEEVGVDDLMVLARRVVARYAIGRLMEEDLVKALDNESLLYLTWRWAYGHDSIPADEAYKLERAFDVDLSGLEGPQGLVVRSGSTFHMRSPDERKGLTLGPTPTVVDILHQACRHWDAGQRRELDELLSETSMTSDDAFWGLSRALAEVLTESREKTVLLGLSGNQDSIVASAHRSEVGHQQLTLGDPG